MKKNEVNVIVKGFNKAKTGKEIFEILEKDDKLFLLVGTPGYYDGVYIMIDAKEKRPSSVYIFDYFKDASEMDSCRIYKKEG